MLRRRDGLAEIAKAQGKSVDGLTEAILAGAKSGLDEAVAKERLTQEQADAIYERLQSSIDDLVNGTLFGPGGGEFGPGFGGHLDVVPPDDGDNDGSNGGTSGATWDTAA